MRFPEKIPASVLLWAFCAEPKAAFIGSPSSAGCERATVLLDCFNSPGGLRSLAPVSLDIGLKEYAVFWNLWPGLPRTYDA